MSALPSRRIPAVAGAASVATLAALLLSGCSALSIPIDDKPTSERTSDAKANADADETNIFDLKVGDCKLQDDVSGGELSDTLVVPCTEPHDEEVYHEFQLPEGDYPAAEEIESTALEQCGVAFTEYVGVQYEESKLEYAYFSPTEEGWNTLDDHLVQCVLFTGDGSQMDSSMKDARA